jgi:hypothetical protein
VSKTSLIGRRAGFDRRAEAGNSYRDLDGLYEELKAQGVVFHQPPHDEPWERAMTAFDPDGYAVEFAQGKRGKNRTNT